jgi:hypothetical protein
VVENFIVSSHLCGWMILDVSPLKVKGIGKISIELVIKIMESWQFPLASSRELMRLK